MSSQCKEWLARAIDVHQAKPVPVVFFTPALDDAAMPIIHDFLAHVRDSSPVGLAHVHWLLTNPPVSTAGYPDEFVEVPLPMHLGGTPIGTSGPHSICAGAFITAYSILGHPSITASWGADIAAHWTLNQQRDIWQSITSTQQHYAHYKNWFLARVAANDQGNLPSLPCDPLSGAPGEGTFQAQSIISRAGARKAIAAPVWPTIDGKRGQYETALTRWYWPAKASAELHHKALAQKANPAHGVVAGK
jgi:hypothetical protein